MLRSWSVRVDVYHMVKKTYHVLTKCVGTVITSSVCRVFIFKDTGSCHPVCVQKAIDAVVEKAVN